MNETESIDIEELELDVSPHDSKWFQSKLLGCFNGLHDADHDDRKRIEGRLHVLQDIFALSDEELIALSERYGCDEFVREITDGSN